MRQGLMEPAWEGGPAAATAWPAGWDFTTLGTPASEWEQWSEEDPLAIDPLGADTAQPLSLLPLVVEESEATEQPDVFEIESNRVGVRVFMVVQASGDEGYDDAEETDEEAEEGLIDHIFLPFGVHR